MSKSVKFDIKLNIDGKDVVVSAKSSVQDLANKLNEAKVGSEGLRASFSIVKWNQVQQAFQNVNNGLQTLVAQMREYTTANAVQVEAETKLATVMRERMGATEGDIAAIRELTSAQQSLGVVGDEVQLMGAQQIATFATNRQTVETLIPAMNNLLVQQKGLSATGQDAVSIGNLLGKALQGNVTALQRVGITFSDAQKKQLKFGNETQRAAVLAEIITANVGDMNAEMAKTDAGKAQQAANAFGDWKEQVGSHRRTDGHGHQRHNRHGHGTGGSRPRHDDVGELRKTRANQLSRRIESRGMVYGSDRSECRQRESRSRSRARPHLGHPRT